MRLDGRKDAMSLPRIAIDERWGERHLALQCPF